MELIVLNIDARFYKREHQMTDTICGWVKVFNAIYATRCQFSVNRMCWQYLIIGIWNLIPAEYPKKWQR